MFKIFKRKKSGFETVSEAPFKVCPSCHARTGKYEGTCPACGGKLEQDSYCTCGALRPASSKYCSFCGLDDFGSRKRRTEFSESQETWQRKESDFGTVFTQSELQAKGYNQFVINPGTTGLLYQRGRFVGMLQPGAHPFKGLGDRFSHFSDKDAFNLILIDVGDMVLPFEIENVAHGNDAHSFDRKNIELKLIFRLENPDFFQLNVIKDQKHLALNWLRERIEAGLVQRVREFVKKEPSLLGRSDFRQQVHVMLLDYFEDSLTRMGMKLVDVEASFSSLSSAHDLARQEALFELKGRYVEIQNTQNLWELERRERDIKRLEENQLYQEEKSDLVTEHQRDLESIKLKSDQFREMEEMLLSGKRGDLTLTEKEIDFYFRKGELELKQADQELLFKEQALIRKQRVWSLEYQELAQQAGTATNRLGVLETLLASQNREKVLNLKSEEDWKRYRQEVDRANILDDLNWAQIQKAAQNKNFEEDSAWEHLQEVLEIQRQIELQKIQDLQKKDLLQSRFSDEILVKQHETTLDELEAQKKANALKHELGLKESEYLSHAEREAKAESIYHQSKINQKKEELELEFMRKDRDLGIKRSTDQADFEDQHRRLQMTLSLEERKHQQKMQEQAMAHEQLLERAKAFDNVSIEAMLANISDMGIRESIIKTMKTRYEGESLNHISKERQHDLEHEIDKLKKDLIHEKEVGALEKNFAQDLQRVKDHLQDENKSNLKDHIDGLKDEHERERKSTHSLTESVMKGAAGVASGSSPRNSTPQKLVCSFCGKPTVLFQGDTKCSHCGASLN